MGACAAHHILATGPTLRGPGEYAIPPGSGARGTAYEPSSTASLATACHLHVVNEQGNRVLAAVQAVAMSLRTDGCAPANTTCTHPPHPRPPLGDEPKLDEEGQPIEDPDKPPLPAFPK